MAGFYRKEKKRSWGREVPGLQRFEGEIAGVGWGGVGVGREKPQVSLVARVRFGMLIGSTLSHLS